MVAFKAYDIRSKYPSEINEELFFKIGRNLKVFGDIKKLVIGYDMRNSSESLRDALVIGANMVGIEVIDIGLASTPMLYHATAKIECDLGIIITASHNSKEYNGMKICRKNAIPISYDTGLKILEEAVKKDKEEFNTDLELKKTDIDFRVDYKESINKFANPKRKLKVILDTGNGIGGLLDHEVLKEHCNLTCLYQELDGTFPNHEANPINQDSLKELKKTVLEQKADIGFAFDGDADRVGFVDDKGEFIPADYLALFLIENYLEQNPNEMDYCYDLRSTKLIEELVTQAGKRPHKTRVGHSYIKEAMRKTNSFFASELACHFYFWFNNNLVYDSALRAAIEVINFLSRTDEKISDIIKGYKVYYKGLETNFEVENKEEIINKIKNNYKDALIENIDGVTIIYGDWWVNVRASNTENVLRLNLEADDKELYDKKLEELKKLII